MSIKMKIVTSFDFFLPPFKQGKSVCSDQLDYPIIIFITLMKTNFAFWEALPERISFFIFSGDQMI